MKLLGHSIIDINTGRSSGAESKRISKTSKYYGERKERRDKAAKELKKQRKEESKERKAEEKAQKQIAKLKRSTAVHTARAQERESLTRERKARRKSRAAHPIGGLFTKAPRTHKKKRGGDWWNRY